MKHTPQRPFVPTPAASPPAKSAGTAAFRIVHPFVHGTKPAAGAAAQAAPGPGAIGPAPRSAPPPLPLKYEPPPVYDPPAGYEAPAESLASIEQFLHTEAPAQSEPSGIDEYAYELPPVEHFMDEPPDEASLAFGGSDEPATLSGNAPSGEIDTSEWGEADWQQFDWRSAATLGEASDPAASNAWLDTDWEKGPAPGREVRESAAKAIADALDGIARRIREGDLALPSPGSISTPGDIAATLAALLGVKR